MPAPPDDLPAAPPGSALVRWSGIPDGDCAYVPIGGLLGALFAGGQSQRMGRDKAAEPALGGLPSLERALAALRAAAPEVGVLGRGAGPAVGGVRYILDPAPGDGPAVALAAFAAAHPGRPLLTCPVDAPCVSAAALRWLGAVGPAGGVLHLEGEPQPVFALWTPAALGRLRARVQAGDRALWRAQVAAGLPRVDPPAALVPAFAQANTPAAWAALLAPPEPG
jgi:molybdopterin-guanine dinucleotide biosynthesis protein A